MGSGHLSGEGTYFQLPTGRETSYYMLYCNIPHTITHNTLKLLTTYRGLWPLSRLVSVDCVEVTSVIDSQPARRYHDAQ